MRRRRRRRGGGKKVPKGSPCLINKTAQFSLPKKWVGVNLLMAKSNFPEQDVLSPFKKKKKGNSELFTCPGLPEAVSNLSLGDIYDSHIARGGGSPRAANVDLLTFCFQAN